MAEIEKYIPKRINKDVSPGAEARDGDRLFFPGDLLDAENCDYDKDGRVRNKLGNILRNFSLGDGVHKVIGTRKYTKLNRLIYFVYNSLNNDKIIEWDPGTSTFTILISGDLGFSPDHPVNQGGTVDDLLIWNDALNRVRRINIAKAKQGFYGTFNDYKISLAIQPPLVPPSTEVLEINDTSLNLIWDDTYQFAYRFIYYNNEVSAFSQLSKNVWLGFFVDPVSSLNKAIRVYFQLPAELNGCIKKVEFAFRRGNNSGYQLFSTVLNPAPGEVSVTFRNNESKIAVATAEETKLYDVIPDVSNALEIVDNRVFLTENKSGFNDNTPNATLALEIEKINLTEEVAGTQRFFKEGGIYHIGLVYIDDFGKCSFVESVQVASVPFDFSFTTEEITVVRGGRTYTYTVNRPLRSVINWSLTGIPPSYAKKYQLVLSKNKFHSSYFQCRVNPHLYVRDIVTGETDNSQTSTHYWTEGKYFLKLGALHADPDLVINGYNLVYLQIPVNIPFVPDSTYFVRFLSTAWPEGADKIVPIITVIGNFLVIDLKLTVKPGSDKRDWPDNFFDWSLFNETRIEVFKQEVEPNDQFYEIGECYDVVNSQFSVTSGTLKGDTYNLRDLNSFYEYATLAVTGEDYNTGTDDTGDTAGGFESPTGIISSTPVLKPLPLYSYLRSNRSTESGTDADNSNAFIKGEASQLINVKTFDYVKVSSDLGRVHTTLKGAEVNDYYNNVLYSDVYAQNTNVNGLSSFFANNNYPISVERSKITSFCLAGDVLVAIHEKRCTSMYIGEGLVREGLDFILVKTQNVIGDDRPLLYSFGCINPESVIEVDANIFFWDALRGAVIRYTKAGLFPISNNGMKEYFFQKSRRLMNYRDTVKVVTAYDYENDHLLITFSEIADTNGNIIEPAETWAFNVKDEQWKTRFSFIPECYGSMETNLVSFKNGQLWEHNRNTIRNNFYGIQYKRSFRFVMNPRPGKEKKPLNFHSKGELFNLGDEAFIPVRLYTPDGQESYIPADRFTFENGRWVAPVLRDINTPVEAGQLALLSGDELVSEYVEVEVFNNRVDESPCREVVMVYKTEEFSV